MLLIFQAIITSLPIAVDTSTESFFLVQSGHTMMSLAIISKTEEHSLHHCLHQCLSNVKCIVGTFHEDSKICSQSSCMRWDSPIVPQTKVTFFGKRGYNMCCDQIDGEMFKGEQMYDCRITAPVVKDCEEILTKGYKRTGLYHFRPFDNRESFDALCDMVTDGGGWTVFQRRRDGGVDFNRNWHNFSFGFGSLLNDFWLGNKFIRLLTKDSPKELRMEVTAESGTVLYHRYKDFSIGNLDSKYPVSFDVYPGDENGDLTDDFQYSNNQKFSTYDSDNDSSGDKHCAELFRGGWWYNECHLVNLNGMLDPDTVATGINWHDDGLRTVYKYSEMKIRSPK